MGNFKKLVLLLSILMVIGIGCKNAQQTLSSTFDVIEDGKTSVPDNPPIPVDPDTGEPVVEPQDKRQAFPSIWLDRSYIETVVSGSTKNFNILIRSSGDPNIADFIKRAKVEYQYTLLERTEGTKSSEEILKNVYLKLGPFQHKAQYFLYVDYAMAAALNSSGQSAKIKVSLFFQDTKGIEDNTGYKPGRLDLILYVKRR